MTGIGLALVDLAVAYFIWKVLSGHLPEAAYKPYVAYAVPTLFFAAVAAIEYYYMNRPGAVDFFIATESEMKKVSWSSRSELLGSTMVVIGTVVVMAFIMWVADSVVIMTYTKVFHLW
jgi:preprotein translocase subunit SecE